MWIIVVFPDEEVAAVPCSWLIEIEGKTKCFWPAKNARTKRAKDDNPPSSGTDKWRLHECRVLMNGGKTKRKHTTICSSVRGTLCIITCYAFQNVYF